MTNVAEISGERPGLGLVYHVAFCLLGLWPRVGWVAALLIPSNFTTTRTSPSARMVSISDFQGASSDIINITPSNGTLSYLTSQSEHLLPIRPYRNFCIAKKKKLDLNFESFPTLLVISPQRWNQLKDAVKPRMEKSPTASVPDVLVFNYKL
ncbi:hypothetical protein PPACK8108_LOCUS26136 [Phakopsora pachyrhizi]|uniref:Uncharacterized protein n=1 Tax=Phakopsora pachyrhizi TaxID=170000 RepID=A0AAV0BV81_PHAPC|nr:hypothetical protein PPACK8108_LOCUS26136 [Phakopsora pachyrhizi]